MASVTRKADNNGVLKRCSNWGCVDAVHNMGPLNSLDHLRTDLPLSTDTSIWISNLGLESKTCDNKTPTYNEIKKSLIII